MKKEPPLDAGVPISDTETVRYKRFAALDYLEFLICGVAKMKK